IDALGRARRIGTDSLSPGFDGLIAGVATGAEVVDATPVLRAARSVKTEAEVRCIITATAIAESGLAAMTSALRPGVTERELLGACRPGATGRDIKEAWAATGEPMPDAPIAHGLGLGMEPPVVTADTGDADVLRSGMVLALTSWVGELGVGGVLERDVVVVRD